jgi:hypothetical protein
VKNEQEKQEVTEKTESMWEHGIEMELTSAHELPGRFALFDVQELAMARKLFTVEESVTVSQRGTFLMPGLVHEGDERFHIGDPLRLVRPDGTEIVTAIDGIDFCNVGPQGEIAVMVALAKSGVPAGTEVWSL